MALITLTAFSASAQNFNGELLLLGMGLGELIVMILLFIVLMAICIIVPSIVIRKRVNNLTKQLEHEKKQMEHSNRFKTMFLANMSHEIRTPLSSIIGFSDLLVNAKTSEERAKYAQIIKANNNLITYIINDILDVSKIELGEININYSKLDLTELLNSVEKVFEVRKREGVELKIVTPYKSCIVHADVQRLTQIINNFVSNAFKFTSYGTIELGYDLEESGGIKIYVKDTGRGIAEEDKWKIFQPFQRLDENIDGTGLGLSIVKFIVEKMNGKVGFDSRDGEGSIFWAILPLTATITEYPNTTPKPATPPKSAEFLTRPLNILVAEDIDNNYILIEGVLREHNLDRAVNGLVAVEKASSHEYDLIIMDIRMPEMDGIEATRAIRAFDQNVKIVALTANAFDIEEKMALDAGCNAFLTKPLKRDELRPFLS